MAATQNKGSEEIATRGMAALEITDELIQQAYDAIELGALPPEVGDPKVTANMIARRIREGTLDASMDPAESLPAWRDLYLDRPVAIYGFHLNPSTIKDSPIGAYAVVELAATDGDDAGDIVTVSCGGRNVLMQLVKALEEKRYPFVGQLTANKTGAGYDALWIKRPEAA